MIHVKATMYAESDINANPKENKVQHCLYEKCQHLHLTITSYFLPYFSLIILYYITKIKKLTTMSRMCIVTQWKLSDNTSSPILLNMAM